MLCTCINYLQGMETLYMALHSWTNKNLNISNQIKCESLKWTYMWKYLMFEWIMTYYAFIHTCAHAYVYIYLCRLVHCSTEMLWSHSLERELLTKFFIIVFADRKLEERGQRKEKDRDKKRERRQWQAKK